MEMNQYSNRIRPILEVDDFGPVSAAKIELRPLTVLIGPSNTGKSYLAILIYALHRALSGRIRHYSPISTRAGSGNSTNLDKQIEVIIERARSDDSERFIDLEGDALTRLLQAAHLRQGSLVFEILRSFGLENDTELRRKFSRRKKAEIRLIRPGDANGTLPNALISEVSRGCQIEIIGPDRLRLDLGDIESAIDGWTDNWGELPSDREEMAFLKSEVWRALFKVAMDPISTRAYYLPADRTGIMHAHRVVVNALIANAPTAGLQRRTSVPMLSGVLSDFLREVIAMDGIRSRRRPRKGSKPSGQAVMAITEQMEASVLNGSIVSKMSRLINYPNFYYKPRGWKSELPLMNASSMVSEMAPLVLYLRHLVGPGETLIIEEPESHLHPRMQIQLTNLLAQLVQVGVRVIVTTHSDWIISCLNNIILRGRRKVGPTASARSGKVDAGTEAVLTESDVGVWFFDKSSERSGSTVSRLEFLEPGRYSPDYEEDLMDLHNEWASRASNWS